jgi:TPR repeat protein
MKQVVKRLEAIVSQNTINNQEANINTNNLQYINSAYINSDKTYLVSEEHYNIISRLVALFIKIINEGKSRDQRKIILDDYLSLNNINKEEIYEWLKNNYMTSLDNMFFLGYLNFSGIGTTLNVKEAFNYFHKASLKGHPTAQYYLGICYENGFGVERIESMALYWYQQAAENNVAIAQYCVGNLYQFGTYVSVDYNLAFYYYSSSTQNECSFGINMLGYCYLNGIGTLVDKKMAFNLYLKAANMDNNVAQYNVAVCFDDGIGTTKDIEKALYWYRKSANNGYNRAMERLNELCEDTFFAYKEKKIGKLIINNSKFFFLLINHVNC